MKPLHLILPMLFLAAAPLANGCTETPDDLPECVGPGSYCPTDAGSDATDAPIDTGTAATPDAESDASEAIDASDGASTLDAPTSIGDASTGG